MHQRPPADPHYNDDLISAGRTNMATFPVAANYQPMAQGGGGYHGEGEPEEGGDHQVDLFDDVFGASGADDAELLEGGAPTTRALTAAATRAPSSTHHHSHHPSDMNRLQQDHATAGYREGLAAAKAASIQAGFDEGYSLGAALGAAVGELLGLLEGLVAAADGSGGDGREELAALLVRARAELAVASIFAPAYFAPDGTWLYGVGAGPEVEGVGGEPREGGHAPEHTVFDVARAHPLVRAWRGRVDALLRRFGVRWGGDGDEAALATRLGLQQEEEGVGEEKDAPATLRTTEPPTGTTTGSRPPPGSSTSALEW